MKHNKMKAKLHAGEPSFGLSIMVPSPQLVEMAGGLGFDWVLLDCEHGTISIEGLELMVMAAEACPAECIHPGDPLNPKEKGLDKLIKRAEPFN